MSIIQSNYRRLWKLTEPDTFAFDAHLLPQEREGAVAGPVLRDDLLLDPATAGILEEVVARIRVFVHAVKIDRG